MGEKEAAARVEAVVVAETAVVAMVAVRVVMQVVLVGVERGAGAMAARTAV